MGIAYLLWLRLRWGVAAISIYLIGLSVAARFVPTEPMVMALCLLTAVIAHLLHVFTLGPADFGVKSSGYPANMFVLPLTTRSLSGWPILYGAASFALLWVLVVYLVLIPVGFSPAVLWPATIAAASAAWVQAVSWMPFPTPFARVPVLGFAAIPLILLGTWATIFFESHTVAAVVTLLNLVWMAVALRFAVLGLARARCGAESTWSIVPNDIRNAAARWHRSIFNKCRTFPSASSAQLWHECRRNVVFLPAMIAIVGVPLLALNCHTVLNPTADRTMLFGSISVTPAVMSLLIWVFVPLMLATSLGQSLGKFDIWGKEGMPSFFAIRPMTTARFVAIKLVAAAISVIVCWAIICSYLFVWALVEASPLNARQSIVRAALADFAPRQMSIVLLGVVGIVVVTWRVVAIGLWPALIGRKLVSNAIAVSSWILLVVAGIVGSWIYRHPEVQPRLVSAIPWIVAVLLLLKISAAAGATFWLHKLDLIDPRASARCLAWWCAAVVATLLCLNLLVPLNWLLTAWVVMLIPLARIAIAPLALHMNRHR
jgi:hypothetical protein